MVLQCFVYPEDKGTTMLDISGRYGDYNACYNAFTLKIRALQCLIYPEDKGTTMLDIS